MEMSTIILYGLAIIGPLMIFLTRYVVKGKTRAAVRLWFITFFMYVIFYWVAKGAIMVTGEEPFSFALLWPIGSILAFWAVEKLLKSDDAGVPYFKWMAFFLIAVLFALVVDALAGAFGWYAYAPGVVTASSSISIPFIDRQVPAVVLLVLGVLMMAAYGLSFNAHVFIRKKFRLDETSATLLLCGVAIFLGYAIWLVTDAVLKFTAG